MFGVLCPWGIGVCAEIENICTIRLGEDMCHGIKLERIIYRMELCAFNCSPLEMLLLKQQ